jgi:thiopurine S-methyltransferase
MQQDYWLKAWAENRTGFHQEKANKRLVRFWSQLGLKPQAEVFVPLAGKSLDMLWLHEQGYRVFGVEISRNAVEAFFVENKLEHTIQESERGTEFQGTGNAEGLRVLAGDFFGLAAADLDGVTGVYDRASLIAMNDAMRADYTAQLAALVPPGATGLLLTIDYDSARMQGPPFAVPDSTTRALLGGAFEIEELEHFSGPERLGNLKDRGLDTLVEYVYRLDRR